MAYLNEFRPELSSGIYSFTKDIFADEATAEKVRRHLSDENDLITDEDLANIKTEMSEAAKLKFQEVAK